MSDGNLGHAQYVERILGFSLRDFSEQYFEKRSCHRTEVALVEEFGLSAEQMMDAVSEFEGGERRGYWIGEEYAEFREKYGTIRSLQLRPDGVRDAVEEGVTVQLIDAGEAFPEVKRFASSLLASLGILARSRIMVWLGATSSGMDLHYDEFDVLQFQIAGRKRWVYSKEPYKAYPTEQATAIAGGEVEIREFGWDEAKKEEIDEALLEQLVMEPGAFLYLPAGSWHRTEAVEGGVSVSVAIGIEQIPFKTILAEIIAERFGKELEWRRPFPSSGKPLRSMNDVQSRFLQDRKDEVCAYLQSLGPGDSAWLHGAMRAASVPAVFRAPPEEVPIEDDMILQLTHRSPAYYVEENDGTVTMYVLEEELRFEPSYAVFAKKLAAQAGTFRAKDAVQWCDAAEKERVYEWLSVLVESRVLDISGVEESG